MKDTKKLISILMAVFLVLGLRSTYAGDVSRFGTAGGMQTVVPVGARYLAMAGSNIATTEGIDGMYWNPAGLSSFSGNAAGVFSTMTIFNDVSVNYMALGFDMGSLGKLGVSLKAFDFGDIPVTTVQDPDGASGRIFSPTFVTVGLTYSAMLTDVIQVGLTGKVISENVDRASASAIAFDAGIQYHDLAGFKGLSFGLVMHNIGTSLQYSGSALNQEAVETNSQNFSDFLNREASIDNLPASFEIGMSYKMDINDQNSLLLSSNFSNYNYGSDNYRFGGEWMFNKMFAIRAGYLYDTNLDAKDQLYTFTAGAGFNYNLSGVDLTIDYSYRDSQYFDGNNLFSIKVGF